MHKIIKEQFPEVLKHKFTKGSQVSKYETKKTNDLHLPGPTVEI